MGAWQSYAAHKLLGSSNKTSSSNQRNKKKGSK